MKQDKSFKTNDPAILFDIIALQDKTIEDLVAFIEEYFREKAELMQKAYKDGKIEEVKQT